MILEYENACKEAGLSEEQIKEIRRFFDAEKKRLKLQKNSKKRRGISYVPISEIIKNVDSKEWEFWDLSCNTEEIVMHDYLLEQLDYELSLLDSQESELIITCFDPDVSLREYSRRTGIPLQTIIDRRNRILEKLQVKFHVFQADSRAAAIYPSPNKK